MFFVINKNKIYTYVITICMVVVLFVLSFAMITSNDETVVTSTNTTNTTNTTNATSTTNITNVTNTLNNNLILNENK